MAGLYRGRLFADAELGEDSGDDVVGGFLACEAGQGVEGLAEGGGDEFGMGEVGGGLLVGDQVAGLGKGVGGGVEGLFVTGLEGERMGSEVGGWARGEVVGDGAAEGGQALVG